MMANVSDQLSAAFQAKSRDDNNGKLQLTRADIQRFIILSDDDFKTTTVPTYEYSYQGEMFVSKGDYLATCVARRFGLAPVIEVQAVTGLVPIAHKVVMVPPSFNSLVLLLSDKLTHETEKKCRITNDVDEVTN